MEIAVLVKVVPRAESLRYDPTTRRVRREATELLTNPFDQRAVRVALELRRTGEAVTVLSMGPPAAAGPLRELRALGVDRVLLLSDPRFAGADTLATSRALTAGLARVGHDLVLAGAWSTDSETGQVPAEVAELLDVPMLSEARAIRRDPAGPGLEVEVDTAIGHATYRARVPLLLSVGEKIAKPLKVDPTALAALSGHAIEVASADDLAIDRSDVGEAGSPTVVGPVREVAPARAPRTFADGSPAERVRCALEALSGLLHRSETPPIPSPPLPSPLPDAGEVLVLVTDRDGELDPYALGLVAEVRRGLPGRWPSVVWVGRPPEEAATYRLERSGAAVGYFVPAEPSPDARVAAAAFGLALDRRPTAPAGLFLSDPFGREVAGRVAARRRLGLVGDALGVAITSDRGIVWAKPSFGGHAVAEIHGRSTPLLATVRPGVFAMPADGPSSEGIVWRRLPPVAVPSAVSRTGEVRETEGFAALEGREVVVAVGMGVGGPEGVARVRTLAAPLGAGLVATRRVVDAGWVPRQLQVGLTGRSLSPRLGVLLGVSGSVNHLVGWRRAAALLAVNSDPSAPVFREVDVGVVGTVEETLPALVEGLRVVLSR